MIKKHLQTLGLIGELGTLGENTVNKLAGLCVGGDTTVSQWLAAAPPSLHDIDSWWNIWVFLTAKPTNFAADAVDNFAVMFVILFEI